ncbi:LamG-like jellyroll fold domain-containing protein [Streptomyces bacillaris]|uniref:LamG-like jellyroll fold domain-containing protein n=1 Tax=Streptomyces bacillaris TaxID=68179 RepID=UPI0035E0DFEC
MAVVLAATVWSGIPVPTGLDSAAAVERTGSADPAPISPETVTVEAEALAEARASGQPVEIPSLRGETRDVHATPAGTLEAREYVSPVRARVPGGWRAVDLGLATGRDGRVAPRTATVELSFSGGGDRDLVRMARHGRTLGLTWPRKLPAPHLDGPVATYAEVLPSVDLRMTAVSDGFLSVLVVKTPEAAAHPEVAELRFGLVTSGLDVGVTSEGALEAKDRGAGGTVFTAPPPLMWDSGGLAGPGGTARRSAPAADGVSTASADPADGPVDASLVSRAQVAVPESGDEMALTPDPALLHGEDTRYPVFIDPQWHSPRASAWAMVSKTYPGTSYWKFNAKPDEGVGNCTGWAGCPSGEVKRVFYRIDTSRFAGTKILSAEFVVRNVFSAQCSNHPVQLWRTKGITSSTTWQTQAQSGFWSERLRTESFHYGGSQAHCKPAGDAEFPIKAAVQAAADQKTSTVTFGLRASDEGNSYHWKRFGSAAHLRVEYNRPPRQIPMSTLTMEYGGACKPPAQPVHVRTLGQITAAGVTDPDGDNVRVQFQVKNGSTVLWDSGLSTAKKSGSAFAVTLPPNLPADVPLHWHARVHDGHEYSPWSSGGSATACYFTYDVSVPGAPGIDSTHYPPSDPADPEDPWHDGVGRYGTFTLTSEDPGVRRFRYGINGDPHPGNEVAATPGAAATVRVLPDQPGLHFITAQALDAAGNASEPRTYAFRVGNGPGPRASWALDEDRGATRFDGTVPERPARLVGGAVPGAEGAVGTALRLDGTSGYAATDGPVTDTSGFFTVSAWARLDRKPDRAAVVAAQTGRYRPGFEIYYSAAQDAWAFNQYRADAPTDDRTARVLASGVDVVPGKWTHLLGSYDGTTLRLYVDGTLAGSLAYADAWDARGELRIGSSRYGAETGAYFPGAIDEVQVFAGFLRGDDPDIARLAAGERIREAPGRPPVALFALDEAAGATAVSGAGEVLPAIPAGGVTPGVPGPGRAAAAFDGTGGHARTSAGAVRTDRSFAVSAWARLDKSAGSGAGIIAAQTGRHAPGFELYYSRHYDRWVFNQYASDSVGATPVRAMQPDGTVAENGEWTHLLGVHDAERGTLTLYVNGREAGRTQHVAWHANGSVQIAAGRYGETVKSFFPGAVADVRIWDRVVTPHEAGRLHQQAPEVAGRWMFESAGPPQLAATGTAPAALRDVTPDASRYGNALTLAAGATIGTGRVDEGALQLDGVTGHADGSVPVDTSGSFTLAGWASAAALPDGEVTAVAVTGAVGTAVRLAFTPDPEEPGWGTWQAVFTGRDEPGAGEVRIGSRYFYDVRDWNHLALVYDAYANEARLYVNGALEETAEGGSWAGNIVTFEASGSFEVGRDLHEGAWRGQWPGSVDDLWVFRGTLDEAQVRHLAAGHSGLPTGVPQVR